MTASRSYSAVQSVQSPGHFSVIWLSRSKQTKPRGQCLVFILSILSVFPVTRESLSLTKTATSPSVLTSYRFYRAMHFSAKRGIAIACRLSVRLSVRPSVRPSVTLVNCDHIGWNSSKIISPLVSLGRSLFVTLTRRVCSKGNTPKFLPE